MPSIRPITASPSNLIPFRVMAIRLTSAHIRQPTLLFRAAASFAAFRCRHTPYLSGYSPAHGRIPKHAAGCGLSSKTDRKKRASLITYPHSVMKHLQNDRTPYSFYGFLNYFRQPRPNCDTSNPRENSKRCRCARRNADRIASVRSSVTSTSETKALREFGRRVFLCWLAAFMALRISAV